MQSREPVINFHTYGKNKTFGGQFISTWTTILFVTSLLSTLIGGIATFGALALFSLGYTLKKIGKSINNIFHTKDPIKNTCRIIGASLGLSAGAYAGMQIGAVMGGVLGAPLFGVGSLIGMAIFGCIGAFVGTFLTKTLWKTGKAVHTVMTSKPEDRDQFVSYSNPNKYKLKHPTHNTADNNAIYSMLNRLRTTKNKADISVKECIPGLDTSYKDVINGAIKQITDATHPDYVIQQMSSESGFSFDVGNNRCQFFVKDQYSLARVDDNKSVTEVSFSNRSSC